MWRERSGGNKKYMNMKHLEAALNDVFLLTADFIQPELQTFLRIILDSTNWQR